MSTPNKKLTDSQIQQDRTNTIMNIVAERASYYRANPHRFAEEFLGIQLKLFQKILLYAMMVYDNFFFIAARGLGKTYLVALFAVCRCILFPGTKIIACSATYKQGKEIILKITDDFMQKSSLLRNEVSKWSTGQNDCYVYFKNGSWIRVVTASENSRGARANILIIDESRMIPQHLVDTVLRPMNAAPRSPKYLNNPEYAHLQEMNKEMYMSSAWYQASEMFDKVKAYTANFLDDHYKYFICDLPYQLSIQEGLLIREAIQNEMSEATFSDIAFMMEREGKFYGSGADSLFNFKVLNDRRVLSESLYSLDFYRKNNLKVPNKQPNEKRILSVDVALLASKKHDNDASALIINSAKHTSGNDYMSNIVYIETQEGLVTEELGLLVMRFYYQYNCDYIALDANGIGQAILDYLMKDRYDPMYAQLYPALNCCNNPDLATRCKSVNAKKVIYAIKANAKTNNDMCLALRAGFQNGNVNLLLQDNNIEEILAKNVKNFSKLSIKEQDDLKLPYIQTTFLIDELINLEHDTNNGLLKVKERHGMRKDRYSSLLYNYFVVQDLAIKHRPKTDVLDLVSSLTMRPGKRFSTFKR